MIHQSFCWNCLGIRKIYCKLEIAWSLCKATFPRPAPEMLRRGDSYERMGPITLSADPPVEGEATKWYNCNFGRKIERKYSKSCV